MSYINTINNFLSKEECELIIQQNTIVELNLGKVSTKTGPTIDLKKRNAKVKFIDLSDVTSRLIKYLNDNEIIKAHILAQTIDKKFQFTKYDVGGHYDWHTDSSPAGEAHRVCSIVIQLNDTYTGGNLLYMDTDDNVIEFKNGIGNLFIFPSNTKHKVTPVLTGTRYSLVSWLDLKTKNIKTII
jgi:predicted 2-oxoglutarate/Fe(II)-dependent dioxygenase YbiX